MADPRPTDLTALDALPLSRAIHAREVSCREVMQAYLDRIRRLNPQLNAIVSLAPADTLLAQADAHDALLARGESKGWMHGLPLAIKDAAPAAGFPTTFGSPLLADAVARDDGLMTARLKAAGCIVIGKTNMPEFGLGSHTFNELFGATRNAWDPTVSAGGSSGGAAVALAQRLLPVADGSDFMGSLRNPAAWNHVFGLRPSAGRVPMWPVLDVWLQQLGTEGPMARSVADLAALLATQAGPDPRVPLALTDPLAPFSAPRDGVDLRGLRIGWLGDLGGHLAVEPGVLEVCGEALQRLCAEGAIVEPLAPGFDAAAVWSAWLVWRRALVAPRVAGLLQQPGGRERIKPEALWEHDQALGTTALDLLRASEARTRFFQRITRHFDAVDLLALPAAQAWPFPIGERWPRQIAGRPMDTYHRWMECTLYATFAGLPAISVPAGFGGAGGWPMGLQLIGRPRGDAALLAVAAAYEQVAADLLARRPPEPPSTVPQTRRQALAWLAVAGAGLALPDRAQAGTNPPGATSGLTASGLAAAARYSAQRRGVSLLVLHRGETVFEDYPNEGAPDRGWETASGTKSFSGVMAAAAVADGLLELDAPCSRWLAEWRDDARRPITVQQLLTLTSGLAPGGIGRAPPYAEALEAPLRFAPGERFQYGPLPFQAFGELMRRALRQAGRAEDPLAYLRERVLGPIGVVPTAWRRGSDGWPLLPQGAALTARGWGRFGQWVLDGGAGVDRAALAACFTATAANPGYGLTWWLLRPGLVQPGPRAGIDTTEFGRLDEEDIVMAAGAGHQRLYLLRRRGLVVVRQASGILGTMLGRGEPWDDAEFLRALAG